MRHVIAIPAALALAATVATFAHAAGPAKNHPILGTWTYTMPDGKCTETYRFRTDGILLITSGQEVSEVKYEVSAKRSEKGFYKLENTIVKDNGKKDCSGQTMEVGRKMTSYVHLETPDDPMAVCTDESLGACFGPLLRAQGQGV